MAEGKALAWKGQPRSSLFCGQAAEKAAAQSDREINGYRIESISITHDRQEHYQRQGVPQPAQARARALPTAVLVHGDCNGRLLRRIACMPTCIAGTRRCGVHAHCWGGTAGLWHVMRMQSASTSVGLGKQWHVWQAVS
jgi:hypothetical protein